MKAREPQLAVADGTAESVPPVARPVAQCAWSAALHHPMQPHHARGGSRSYTALCRVARLQSPAVLLLPAAPAPRAAASWLLRSTRRTSPPGWDPRATPVRPRHSSGRRRLRCRRRNLVSDGKSLGCCPTGLTCFQASRFHVPLLTWTPSRCVALVSSESSSLGNSTSDAAVPSLPLITAARPVERRWLVHSPGQTVGVGRARAGRVHPGGVCPRTVDHTGTAAAAYWLRPDAV